MGNTQDKHSLRKAHSVPDTHALPNDAQVLYREKSRSSQRLNQPSKGGKQSKGKKSKHNKDALPEFQLPPSEAVFLPAFPLRGDLEDLDFEVVEVIAKGAYGNVIKVQREDDKRFYAIKILDKAQILQDDAVRQCKDEAVIQSMVGEHPFVVKAYEYWQSHTNLYLVLDYVPHGDMFTLWTFHGAFPEDLVRLYIAEMAMVIDYLHSECIIYRDIKMENILFDASGHIQLTDFGLAKRLQSGDNTRTVCGTLQYMAPEVLSVYPYGHPADWWSVGILMYTMVAGSYPVDGMDTHTRMAQKVFECDYLLPSDISDSAQDVINRVLTKSPHKRLCDLYHLQDLHFFQDLIFSDLMDRKINPIDVVPPDFFPMTGTSWAPHVFSQADDGGFDQFDDTNANYDGAYATDADRRNDPYEYESYDSHHSPYHRHSQQEQQPELRQHKQPRSDDHRNSGYRDSPSRARSKAYPQGGETTTSTSGYNHHNSEHASHVSASSSSSVRRDSAQEAMNPDRDFNRRDRFGSSSSSGPNSRGPQSSVRGSQQILPSSNSYNQDLRYSDAHQNHPSYPVSSGSQHRERDLKNVGSHRRSSRDRDNGVLVNEMTSRPPYSDLSSQPPSLPKNPPPVTLPSQSISPPHSSHSSTFKMVEPTPTLTLTPKFNTNNNNNINNNNNYKIDNHFPNNAYVDNQAAERGVIRPVSAILVTSPTTKLPPHVTGYTQVEEARIELPTSPVVKILPSHSLAANQFIPPHQQSGKPVNSVAPNYQCEPPKPPPQASKPTNSLPTNHQFQLQQLPQPPPQSSKPNASVTSYGGAPQPPPQSSKPAMVPKPVVAPKPAVRKSFNTKKAYKPPPSSSSDQSHFVIKPDSIQTHLNASPPGLQAQGYPPTPNVNHSGGTNTNSNSSLDVYSSSTKPQGNIRPIPVPRPRQTVRRSVEVLDTSEESGHDFLLQQSANPERDGYNVTGDQPDSAEMGGDFHWNLPTSSIPSFV